MSIKNVGTGISHSAGVAVSWSSRASSVVDGLSELPVGTEDSTGTYQIRYTQGTHRQPSPSADYLTGYDVVLKEGAPVRKLLQPFNRDVAGVQVVSLLEVKNLPPSSAAADFHSEHERIAAIVKEVAQDKDTLRGSTPLVLDFRDDHRDLKPTLRADTQYATFGVRSAFQLEPTLSASSNWRLGIYLRENKEAGYEYVIYVEFYALEAYPIILRDMDGDLNDLTGSFATQVERSKTQASTLVNDFLARINDRLTGGLPGRTMLAVRDKTTIFAPLNAISKLARATTEGFTHVLRVGTVPTGPIGASRAATTAVLLGPSQGLVLFTHYGTQAKRPSSVPLHAAVSVGTLSRANDIVEEENVSAYVDGHMGRAHWVGARSPATIAPDRDPLIWASIYDDQFYGLKDEPKRSLFLPLGQITASETTTHLSLIQQLRRGPIPEDAEKPSADVFQPIGAGATPGQVRERISASRPTEGVSECESFFHARQTATLVMKLTARFLMGANGIDNFTAGRGDESLSLADIFELSKHRMNADGKELTITYIPSAEAFIEAALDSPSRAQLTAHLNGGHPPPLAMLKIEEGVYM